MADRMETVDLSVYDQNRLFRLPNTKNSKSGLWKVSLQAHELLTLSEEKI